MVEDYCYREQNLGGPGGGDRIHQNNAFIKQTYVVKDGDTHKLAYANSLLQENFFIDAQNPWKQKDLETIEILFYNLV